MVGGMRFVRASRLFLVSLLAFQAFAAVPLRLRSCGCAVSAPPAAEVVPFDAVDDAVLPAVQPSFTTDLVAALVFLSRPQPSPRPTAFTESSRAPPAFPA